MMAAWTRPLVLQSERERKGFSGQSWHDLLKDWREGKGEKGLVSFFFLR
jgi:hypothetical protein